MKTSTLLSAGMFLLLAARSVTLNAADPRLNGGSAASARGLFGLPMPQQWSGARPVSTGYNSNRYSPTGYNANCPNGNCANTNYRTGYGVAAGNCANGQCGPGACANGQCATGTCPNGQCGPGACANGQCATGNCPNGNCGPGLYSGNRLLNRAELDWAPRSARTGQADPYRRAGTSVEAEGWSQRTQRPVLAPLNDATGSRYRRDDLNLRDEYFGNEPGDRYDLRSQPQTRSRQNEWNQPARRSMEAPAESFNGVARF